MSFAIPLTALVLVASIGVTLGPPERRTVPVAIDPHVYKPYDKENYPKDWESWGKAGMARVERSRVGAAKLVSFDPRCDKVELAELSDKHSLATSVLVIFVDCTNRFRRYVDEADARAELRRR